MPMLSQNPLRLQHTKRRSNANSASTILRLACLKRLMRKQARSELSWTLHLAPTRFTWALSGHCCLNVHTHKCLYCMEIKPATSYGTGEYLDYCILRIVGLLNPMNCTVVSIRISNTYGSVTALKQWPNQKLSPRGGA
jgi:hypothetical protein